MSGHERETRGEASMPHVVMGYRVSDLLGRGAGSDIYAARPPHGSQLYALKHVVVKTKRDLRFIGQLKNEFAVSQKVQHPNLRRALEWKLRRNFMMQPVEAILVMDLFDGQRLDRLTDPSVGALLGYFIQAAQALHAMHRAGYLHCDTKPNNILVNAVGAVKVIDLGQACPIGSKKQRVQGTADYMAPEQVKRGVMSAQTDVFNFGATFYWALTHRSIPTLFTLDRGSNSFLLDRRISTPAELNPNVPVPLSNIVMECVRTNPAKRPPDMAEVGRRLETVEYGLKRNAERSGAAPASSVLLNSPAAALSRYPTPRPFGTKAPAPQAHP